MFSKIFNWVKTHKLLAFNILVVAFLALNFFGPYFNTSSIGGGSRYAFDTFDTMENSPASLSPMNSYSSAPKLSRPSTSLSTTQERKVITNSNFSLLVKNVNEMVENVMQKTFEVGGFMVDTSIRRDEEADSATIEVRVPSDKLDEFSKYLRSTSVKVVYEKIMGHDITDQYTDYEKRIQSLEFARGKLESILDRAVTADEILNVQSRIFEIQDQIDYIRGQLDYMDKASNTSKVTITISTDEMSLPYQPVGSWRPDVIFKQAVRALISVIRAVGTLGIWFAVFAPLIALFIVLKKMFFKKRVQ